MAAHRSPRSSQACSRVKGWRQAFTSGAGRSALLHGLKWHHESVPRRGCASAGRSDTFRGKAARLPRRPGLSSIRRTHGQAARGRRIWRHSPARGMRRGQAQRLIIANLGAAPASSSRPGRSGRRLGQRTRDRQPCSGRVLRDHSRASTRLCPKGLSCKKKSNPKKFDSFSQEKVLLSLPYSIHS